METTHSDEATREAVSEVRNHAGVLPGDAISQFEDNTHKLKDTLAQVIACATSVVRKTTSNDPLVSIVTVAFVGFALGLLWSASRSRRAWE